MDKTQELAQELFTRFAPECFYKTKKATYDDLTDESKQSLYKMAEWIISRESSLHSVIAEKDRVLKSARIHFAPKTSVLATHGYSADKLGCLVVEWIDKALAPQDVPSVPAQLDAGIIRILEHQIFRMHNFSQTCSACAEAYALVPDVERNCGG